MPTKRLTGIARKLRRDSTEAERRLWNYLRARQMGVQFTRQLQIGDFVVDFACRRLRIAIELDGGQHAENTADLARTKAIEAHGYRVIRFWNDEVLGNAEGVLRTLAAEIALARSEN